MSLHKLTAGDGYTYLTQQVAALDATHKGHVGLDAYYCEKGETPGRWLGAGLVGLEGIDGGDEVTAEHMRSLFGEGRHPDADAIEAAMIKAGATPKEALAASMLGRRFPEFDTKSDFRAACRTRFEEYNSTIGLPRDWPVPAEDRASIRTQVGREMFAAKYDRPPADPRELAGFISRSSRPAVTAVAGYDLTFSPVKSVSTLWAVAPRDIAEQIEEAHQAAVTDAVAWVEAQASYTRTGAGGVRQVDILGLLAVAFIHRDARSGDPDLHTHVAISNKVQTVAGRWLALDGRVLHKAVVAASERYNTRLEAEVVARLGLRFEERSDADSRKRPVREVVGVDERLNMKWSSRRASIDTRRAELAAGFQGRQGRPPTAIEALKLAQQATLETRQAKHEPRSFAQQREAWRADALTVLAGEGGLARMVRRALHPKAGEQVVVDDAWVQEASKKVIGVVEGSRATWQMWHVRAETERYVRGGGVAPGDVERAVEAVVEVAVSSGRSIRLGAPDPVLEPSALRRADGASVYTVAGGQLMTSAEIVAAEKSLVEHAARTGGRRVSQSTLDLALLESAANGVMLNPAQAQMVADLATSTSRLQLAIAPAGSGKTTAMRVLSRAWSDEGGQVIGLAPTAAAAAVLGAEIGSRADTLAKVNWSLTSANVPDWVAEIGRQTLVIIDEAGMSGTLDLARVADYVIARGGSIRLVGDDQQLASIAAGGVLRDIAETAGASTLSELVRFSDPAEGAATLGLRAGDSEALGFYLDNGRVRVGDESTMADDAYKAWAADRTAGRDAVMLAPTRDLVSDLNVRARGDRLALFAATNGGVAGGRELTLADGNQACAGDVVISRKNNRKLPITSSDWVKNGDRWTIVAILDSGDLRVRHLRLGRTITMPAEYVQDSVELGYASTVHGAQGLTADRCHVIATGSESRQLFYVAMTRGRQANCVYLSVVGDGDPHNIIKPETISPATPTEILTAILGRDQAQRSATSSGLDLSSPQVQLAEATARYRDALGFAAEGIVGPEVLAALDAAAEQVHPGLGDCPGYGTLRAHLAVISLSGRDAHAALRAAAGSNELGTALDPAAVLDWRLDTTGGHSGGAGPLPWLPGVPVALAEHPQWGQYLTARTARVVDLAEQVRIDAAMFTPDTAPSWAARLVDTEHQQVRGDLAVWRAAMGVAAAT
jgi:conjugative relaxase-like TrwC/TraI family protein